MAERSVKVVVTKSHDLENSTSLLERYYKLGNAFADLAAKKVTQEAGIVEFQQTRQSAGDIWNKPKNCGPNFFHLTMQFHKCFYMSMTRHPKKIFPLPRPNQRILLRQ